jgi:hypothetical protein
MAEKAVHMAVIMTLVVELTLPIAMLFMVFTENYIVHLVEKAADLMAVM